MDPNSSDTSTRLAYYKRRYNKAYSIAVQWWAIEQACYHYAIPCRDIFYWSNYTQGAQKNNRVYETTAVHATRNFVSKMQNGLVPPQQTWAKLTAGSDIPDDQKEEVNEICEQYTQVIFDYIRRSNFDMVISECLFDLAVGTAALMVQEGTDEDPFKFHSIPMAQIAIEESINGYVDTVYRAYGEVKIAEIPLMWPNANMPDWMIEQMNMDPNSTVKSLFEGVIYINGNPKPYRNVLWTDANILIETEDVSSPWIVFRWSKINNETMGRGPLMDAIPSILSLNQAYELELKSANFNINRPFMAFSDGILNPYLFQLEANTIIPVAPTGNGQWPIQPIPDASNPNFAQLSVNDLRMQINALLFNSPLGPVNETPTRTATEVSIRQRNLAEEIGPVYPRLQTELLARLMKRLLHILKKKGLIDPIVINGREIELKYQSPLVIAQGQLDVQAFLQYQQAMQGIVGPEAAIANLNPAEFPYWMAEKLGIDPKVLIPQQQFKDQLARDSEKQQLAQLQSLGLPAGIPGGVPPGAAG